jgi:hypothetical protein
MGVNKQKGPAGRSQTGELKPPSAASATYNATHRHNEQNAKNSAGRLVPEQPNVRTGPRRRFSLHPNVV